MEMVDGDSSFSHLNPFSVVDVVVAVAIDILHVVREC